MKCPICGGEIENKGKGTAYHCDTCGYTEYRGNLYQWHRCIRAKEQAAEKRGAEKVIRALEDSAVQTRRFAKDVDIMSWGSGFETAISVAKSALKAYEEGNNA